MISIVTGCLIKPRIVNIDLDAYLINSYKEFDPPYVSRNICRVMIRVLVLRYSEFDTHWIFHVLALFQTKQILANNSMNEKNHHTK